MNYQEEIFDQPFNYGEEDWVPEVEEGVDQPEGAEEELDGEETPEEPEDDGLEEVE